MKSLFLWIWQVQPPVHMVHHWLAKIILQWYFLAFFCQQMMQFTSCSFVVDDEFQMTPTAASRVVGGERLNSIKGKNDKEWKITHFSCRCYSSNMATFCPCSAWMSHQVSFNLLHFAFSNMAAGRFMSTHALTLLLWACITANCCLSQAARERCLFFMKLKTY